MVDPSGDAVGKQAGQHAMHGRVRLAESDHNSSVSANGIRASASSSRSAGNRPRGRQMSQGIFYCGRVPACVVTSRSAMGSDLRL